MRTTCCFPLPIQKIVRPFKQSFIWSLKSCFHPGLKASCCVTDPSTAPEHLWAAAGRCLTKYVNDTFRVIGKGSGHWSFVHIEDAATATLAAVDALTPGVYNICDASLRRWQNGFRTLPNYRSKEAAVPAEVDWPYRSWKTWRRHDDRDSRRLRTRRPSRCFPGPSGGRAGGRGFATASGSLSVKSTRRGGSPKPDS